MEACLTTTEVAKRLDVSVATLHLWKKSGRLVPTQLSNRNFNLYTERQVDEFRVQLESERKLSAGAGDGLPATQAAEFLGVSVRRLRSLDRSGQLEPTARSASNRRKYSKDQLAKFKERMSTDGIAPTAAQNLMSRVEAAQYLGVDVSTMRHWETDKKFTPVLRNGTTRLYRRGDVEELHRTRELKRTTEQRITLRARDLEPHVIDRLREPGADAAAILRHFIAIGSAAELAGLNEKKK